ncbi:hypothetical protein FOA52_012199 [Chlamydomonas sp. UWO 241]|nr:hypothetical protein FOA52_012199 [Chlamydomonas sp. UWO 241]
MSTGKALDELQKRTAGMGPPGANMHSLWGKFAEMHNVRIRGWPPGINLSRLGTPSAPADQITEEAGTAPDPEPVPEQKPKKRGSDWRQSLLLAKSPRPPPSDSGPGASAGGPRQQQGAARPQPTQQQLELAAPAASVRPSFSDPAPVAVVAVAAVAAVVSASGVDSSMPSSLSLPAPGRRASYREGRELPTGGLDMARVPADVHGVDSVEAAPGSSPGAWSVDQGGLLVAGDGQPVVMHDGRQMSVDPHTGQLVGSDGRAALGSDGRPLQV